MYVCMECVSDDNGRVFGQHSIDACLHYHVRRYIHTNIWVLVTELGNCKDVLLARKDLILFTFR